MLDLFDEGFKPRGFKPRDLDELKQIAEQEAPGRGRAEREALGTTDQKGVRKLIVQKRDEEKNINQSIRLFFFCLFLIFPMVVRTMIDANLCRKLNEQGDEWLMVDLDISCDDPDYTNVMLLFFRAGAAVYPLGVPLGLFVLLRHHRLKLRQLYGQSEGLERFKDRFEFLVRDYKVSTNSTALQCSLAITRTDPDLRKTETNPSFLIATG